MTYNRDMFIQFVASFFEVHAYCWTALCFHSEIFPFIFFNPFVIGRYLFCYWHAFICFCSALFSFCLCAVVSFAIIVFFVMIALVVVFYVVIAVVFVVMFVVIGLTPLIALIYISVEPAVSQNCVASVTNKQKYANNKNISANDKRFKEYERKDFTVKTKRCPTIGMHFKKGFNKLNKHVPTVYHALQIFNIES